MDEIRNEIREGLRSIAPMDENVGIALEDFCNGIFEKDLPEHLHFKAMDLAFAANLKECMELQEVEMKQLLVEFLIYGRGCAYPDEDPFMGSDC